MSALDEIRAAFARRGVETYGEGVSQLEHACNAPPAPSVMAPALR